MRPVRMTKQQNLKKQSSRRIGNKKPFLVLVFFRVILTNVSKCLMLLRNELIWKGKETWTQDYKLNTSYRKEIKPVVIEETPEKIRRMDESSGNWFLPVFTKKLKLSKFTQVIKSKTIYCFANKWISFVYWDIRFGLCSVFFFCVGSFGHKILGRTHFGLPFYYYFNYQVFTDQSSTFR